MKLAFPIIVAVQFFLLCCSKSRRNERGEIGLHNQDGLQGKYSCEVLPENREMLMRPVGPNDLPCTVAHDVPQLIEELYGPYSYLGSAREFKHIAGGNLPDWIKPTKGNCSISKRGYGLTCWSYLDYEFDPARGKELRDLISQGFSKKWPKEKPIQWIVRPMEDGTGNRVDGMARIAKPGLILVHRLVIHILPNGRLHLADTRGVDPDS